MSFLKNGIKNLTKKAGDSDLLEKAVNFENKIGNTVLDFHKKTGLDKTVGVLKEKIVYKTKDRMVDVMKSTSGIVAGKALEAAGMGSLAQLGNFKNLLQYINTTVKRIKRMVKLFKAKYCNKNNGSSSIKVLKED